MAAKAKTGFSGLDKSKTLAENTVNAGPVVLDSNVTFMEAPSSNWDMGRFVVTVDNHDQYDHLTIGSIGGISAISISDTHGYVSYNGVLIGEYIYNGGPEIYVIIENSANNESLTALARAIEYSYTGDAPPAAARSIYFSAVDRNDNWLGATMQLKLKAENDLPVFSGLDAQSVHSASQAATGVLIDADAHVTNPDGTGFKAGKLSVHLAGATATDQLYLGDGDFSITGKKLYLAGKQVGTVSADGHNGHDLSFTFKAAVSDAQISELMAQVSYRTTDASAPTGARDVTFTVTDAEKSAASAHVSLVFETDAPTLLSASLVEADPLATLKAAVSGTPDDLSHLFARLEERAAGLLEASEAHTRLVTDLLPDLHLPEAVSEYLDAIGSSIFDHAQASYPELLQDLGDRAKVLEAHVQEVLHPAHGSAEGLI